MTETTTKTTTTTKTIKETTLQPNQNLVSLSIVQFDQRACKYLMHGANAHAQLDIPRACMHAALAARTKQIGSARTHCESFRLSCKQANNNKTKNSQ